jgi:hypothetical protein
MVSTRFTKLFHSDDYTFRLDYNNENIAGNMWFDGTMLIDLTASFGVGNEPSQEWCDQYISYFLGTYEKTGYEDDTMNNHIASENRPLQSNTASRFYSTNSVFYNNYIDTLQNCSMPEASASFWAKIS